MNYQEALDYLFGFVDYSRTHQENIAPENFDLARMRELLAQLGNPQLSFPTIHVAGTKGKGSVSVLCASVLRAAGYRVGLYTSPHLHRFNERIQVDGEHIPDEQLAAIISEFPNVVEVLTGVTSYELQTALAFVYFARQEVDIAVIEVGLGGRLDSTNVITPEVSVITSISLDHTAVLGDTLEAIAAEKGGIIKTSVPVVAAPQAPGALAVLERIATERQAPFHPVSHEVQITPVHAALAGQRIRINGFSRDVECILALLGPHQLENAAVAFAALCVLDEGGFSISDHAIQTGFEAVRWPGRFEVVSTTPPVVLDGAHNRHSASMLVQSLDQYFPDQPRIYLFGASADKDIIGMFAELLRNAHMLVVTESEHPRATPAAHLAKLASPSGVRVVQQPDVPAALEQAITRAIETGGVVVATGSLYALGEMRAAWLARK
jgi:dihydrofolate synthase/folylpolyglutamate synthase